MNIVLTGFMATGKTAIGRAIADKSRYRFEDTDSMIVTESGMEISEIFERYVEKAAQSDGTVIATGGGVVLDKRNVEALRKNGIIFNLDPDFAVIEERVGEARATRPLMKGESMDEIRERFLKRKPFYDDCDVKIRVIKGRTPASYAEEILSITEEKLK